MRNNIKNGILIMPTAKYKFTQGIACPLGRLSCRMHTPDATYCVHAENRVGISAVCVCRNTGGRVKEGDVQEFAAAIEDIVGADVLDNIIADIRMRNCRTSHR